MTPATNGWGIAAVAEFTLAPSSKPAMLLHRGRRVGPVRATQLDAQFRLANGSFLLLASDTTPFKEHLAIVHASPDGRLREEALIGGAYTPGTLSYAHPSGPNRLVFCFHDLEQEVTVEPQRRWRGLRRHWLTLREPEHVSQR